MYVIRVATGFCQYFVQHIEIGRQHVRYTSMAARAARFRTAAEARKHTNSIRGEVAYLPVAS